MNRDDRTVVDAEVDASGSESLPGPGSSIGGYRLERVVGVGGMGVVYEATEPDLGRTVALKIIAPEISGNARIREMFVRESQAAASIEHPNVLPIYRAGLDGEHLYIAMRFVSGSSLGKVIEREGALSPSRSARIVAQVGSALDAAHKTGLVHRDVKPGNILISELGPEEHAYLADFGLAAAGGLGQPTPVDAPGYSSPESAAGGPDSPAMDVYALGRVLVACLTGNVAPDGDPAASVTTLALPQGFLSVLQRALAEDPGERFDSPGDFSRELARLRYDAVLVADPAAESQTRDLVGALRNDGLDVRASAPNEDVIGLAAGAVVLVGRSGLGEWAREPLTSVRRVADSDPSFRRLAVLMPGAPPPDDSSLDFLTAWPLVDLRDAPDAPAPAIGRAIRGPSLAQLGAAAGECPYRGLEPFDESTAEYYVGREQDVVRLVEALRRGRFLAVLGPSGSGKSSLVRAGLVTALRDDALAGSGAWAVAVARPGADPETALATAAQQLGAETAAEQIATDPTALDRAVACASGTRAVLVLDQFEELFTMVTDGRRRNAVINGLVHAATVPGGRLTVVLAMRADFYARLAENDDLRALVAEHQYLVGPMRAADVLRAIEEPARRAGLRLEPGLARTIVEDVADRPSGLPLVSFLLYELWRKRRGQELTLESYAASGGVEGALARRADEVYDALPPEQRTLAPSTLLRLTEPGEGTEDTRRRAALDDLVQGEADRPATEALVARLAEARLLSVAADSSGSRPVVEIGHEALLRAWPRLRQWINDDRDGLRLGQRLATATAEWESAGQEEGLLYRGAALAAWRERDQSRLNARERGFLDASVARAERETEAKRRRTRITVASLATGVAALGGVLAYALVQQRETSKQRDVALSRQLAASGREQLDADPEVSLILARSAYASSPTREAEEILRQATLESAVRGSDVGHDGPVVSAAAADGVLVSGGADGELRFSGTDLASPLTVNLGGGAAHALAAAPDGSLFAVASEDGTLRLLDRTGDLIRAVPLSRSALRSVAVAPSRRAVAVGDAAGVLHVVDPRSGRHFELRGHADVIGGVAFSPDGTMIATASGEAKPEDFTVRLWSVARRAQLQIFREFLAPIFGVAFTPDGRSVVGASGDNTVRVLPVAGGKAQSILDIGAVTHYSLAVAPDGLVVVGGSDGVVRLWRPGDPAPAVALRGHSGIVRAVAVLPGQERLLTASDDGSARLWHWSELVVGRAPKSADTPDDVAFVGNAERALRAVSTFRGEVYAWTAGQPKRRLLIRLPKDTTSAAFSRDGQRLISGGAAGTVTLHEMEASPPRTQKLRGLTGDVASTAISAAGLWLAAADGEGEVRRWRVDASAGGAPGAGSPLRTDPAPETLAVADDGSVAVSVGDEVQVWLRDGTKRSLDGAQGGSRQLAFAPGATAVAAAGADGTVRVWMTSAPQTPVAVLRRAAQATSVQAVEFSSDGRLLAVSTRSEVRVWDWQRQLTVASLSGGDLLDAAFSASGRTVLTVPFVPEGESRPFEMRSCAACGPVDSVLKASDGRVTRQLSETEQALFAASG